MRNLPGATLANWRISKAWNQRFEMYIVISKPRRMSVAVGFSHFISSLLSVFPQDAVVALAVNLTAPEQVLGKPLVCSIGKLWI